MRLYRMVGKSKKYIRFVSETYVFTTDQKFASIMNHEEAEEVQAYYPELALKIEVDE